MDDYIYDDILTAIAEKRYPWLNLIVSEIKEQPSPFLTPDLNSITFSQSIFATRVAKMFLSIGKELKISFDQNSSKDFSSNLFTSIHFSQLSEKSSKQLELHFVYLTFQLPEIEPTVQFIEPILGTLVLYDSKTKKIISDSWNYIPKISKQFLPDNWTSTTPLLSASFHVDPKLLMEKDRIKIILFFSHPTMADNSGAVIKHYFNPTPVSGNALRRPIDTSFLKNPKAFSTFAWTYVTITSEHPSQYDFPSPYFIDHPLCENEINYLISEAQNKHLRQLPFKISMKTNTALCPIIMRPLSVEKVRPYLQPIHQLSVSLVQLKMSGLSSARNVMVAISFVESPNSAPIPAIHSKLNPSQRVEIEYSRIWYHEKSPRFDDTFLIDLPYPPKPTWALLFTIYHVHVKPTECKSPTEIGKAILPLLKTNTPIQLKKSKDKFESKEEAKNDDPTLKKKAKIQIEIPGDNSNASNQSNNEIFIPNEVHTIPFSSDKNSKLMVSTYLRSNLMTTDKNYHEFIKLSNSPDETTLNPDLIRSIEPATLASNMMIVIDTILNIHKNKSTFDLSSLLILRETLLPIMSGAEFKQFSLLYVYFYAFRCMMSHNSDSYLLEAATISQASSDPSLPINHNMAKHILTSESFAPDSFNKYNPEFLNNQSQHEYGDLISFSNQPQAQQPNGLSAFPYSDHHFENLQIDSSNLPLYLKIFKGTSQWLRDKKTKAIDMFYPLLEFLIVLIIKSLYLTKKRELSNDFCNFVDDFSRCSSSSKNISKIAIMFGRFVDLLFDIGCATGASLAFSAFTRYTSPKAIVNFVSTSFRPEFFLYLVLKVESFCARLEEIVIQAFRDEYFQIMKSLFITINRLCKIYDDNLKVDIASKLLPCIAKIKPSELPKSTSIADGIAFIDFILNYSSKSAISLLASTDQLPMLMSLLHYLLNKSTPKIEEKKERQAKWKILAMPSTRRPVTDSSPARQNQIAIKTPLDVFQISKQSSTTRPTKDSFCDLSGLKDTTQSNRPQSTIIKQQLSGSQVLVHPQSSIPSNPNLTQQPKLPVKDKRKEKQTPSTNALSSASKLTKSRPELSLTETANSESSELRSLTTLSSSSLDLTAACYENESEINEKILKTVFRFVRIFLNVSESGKYPEHDTYLVGFVFHALQQVVLERNLILESYEMFEQIIGKFSPNIIDISKPCFTRIMHSLFKSTLLSTQFHESIASIVQTLFQCDLRTNHNNNRSVVICVRALSLMEYPQLILDRFQRFMAHLRGQAAIQQIETSYTRSKLGKSNRQSRGSMLAPIQDGITKFFETFESLTKISTELANPKLTPSQRSELLFKRFYAFKYSPDAQISVLDDLKKHQINTEHELEAINITILQAAVIYEYLIKLKRIPDYFGKSSFSGKHRDHFTITSKSRLSKTKKSYFIGSTSFCPNELFSDFPKCPSFCDPDVFSESGFLSVLYEAMLLSKKCKRYVFLNEIVDLLWPIYHSHHCYEQMSAIFKEMEWIYDERFDLLPKSAKGRSAGGRTASDASSLFRNSINKQIKPEYRRSRNNSESDHLREKINFNKECHFDNKVEEIDDYLVTNKSYVIDNSNNDSFFRVMFCGTIFESDNGRAFIYRAEPNTTKQQFESLLLDYYEKLIGEGKIIIIQDEVEKPVENKHDKDLNMKLEHLHSYINKSNSQETVQITSNKADIQHSASSLNKSNSLKTLPAAPNSINTDHHSDNHSSSKDLETENQLIDSLEIVKSDTVSNELASNQDAETTETEEKAEANGETTNLSHNGTESENTDMEETMTNEWYNIPYQMDENLGYIKIDKVNFVLPGYNTFQHQIFSIDEYSYDNGYRFIDDYFFNSSHNYINQCNFKNVSSFISMNNTYENNTLIFTYDNVSNHANKNTASQGNNKLMNYNYSYFNIYNYMNNYAKMVIYKSEVPPPFIDITKRCMRRNILAIRTQLPSVITRSEIIKIEAFDYSPIMVAYKHLADFSKDLNKAIDNQQSLTIHSLLNDELINNSVDNFVKIVESFTGFIRSYNLDVDRDEYSYDEEEENYDWEMFEAFVEENQKIRQARVDSEKEAVVHFKEILILFLKTLQKGIESHSKWVVNHLEYISLQYQFESILELYKKKIQGIL